MLEIGQTCDTFLTELYGSFEGAELVGTNEIEGLPLQQVKRYYLVVAFRAKKIDDAD